MTVARLIEMLKTMPESAEVVVGGADHSFVLVRHATLRPAEPGDNPGEMYEAGPDIVDPIKVVVLS